MSLKNLSALVAAVLAASVLSASPVLAQSPAQKAPATTASARAQMQAFTRSLKGLEARFSQQVYDPNAHAAETSSGTVQLSAPRQFRWQYLKPAPQLIVADGDHIWIYDPDLEQVTVRQQSLAEQGSPLAVLIDPTELDRQYKVSEGGRSAGLDWLVLEPKRPDDAPFQNARLGFSSAGLARMELKDSLGQKTVISFLDWKRNPRFAPGTFQFKPPAGVDVVGQVSPGAEVTPLRP